MVAKVPAHFPKDTENGVSSKKSGFGNKIARSSDIAQNLTRFRVLSDFANAFSFLLRAPISASY